MLLFGCSVMSNPVIPSTAAGQASLSFTTAWSLLKLVSIDLVMPVGSMSLQNPNTKGISIGPQK